MSQSLSSVEAEQLRVYDQVTRGAKTLRDAEEIVIRAAVQMPGKTIFDLSQKLLHVPATSAERTWLPIAILCVVNQGRLILMPDRTIRVTK